MQEAEDCHSSLQITGDSGSKTDSPEATRMEVVGQGVRFRLYDSKATISTDLFSEARLKVVIRMALPYDEKATLPLCLPL